MSASSSYKSPNLARSRWTLLQQAIVKKEMPQPKNPASKRVFERYSSLVSWTTDPKKSMMNVHLYVPVKRIIMRSTETPIGILLGGYRRSENGSSKDRLKMTSSVNQKSNFEYCTALYPVQLCRKNVDLLVNIQNLKGFDKTGRICIWPSEQILAYSVLRNLSFYKGKKVIEIGGGFHCLAGLTVAKYSEAKQVVLTDGDLMNAGDIRYSIEKNNISEAVCQGTTLRWGAQGMKPEFQFQFDVVIAADVVYEMDTFTDLLATITLLLKPGGRFILFNPTRNGLLDKFVSLSEDFKLKVDNNLLGLSDVRWIKDYDAYVTDLAYQLMKNNPSFNKDWHYPNQVIWKQTSSPVVTLEELVAAATNQSNQ